MGPKSPALLGLNLVWILPCNSLHTFQLFQEEHLVHVVFIVLLTQLFISYVIYTEWRWWFVAGIQHLCFMVYVSIPLYLTVATVPCLNLFTFFNGCVLAQVLGGKKMKLKPLNKAVFEPQISPSFAITYFYNNCYIRFRPIPILTPHLKRWYVQIYPRINMSKSHEKT